MKKQNLAIGEVARAAGISASALRYYESIGLLPAPRRLNGRRLYDESVFAHLAAINLARDAGFTVSEIKDLLQNCTEVPSKLAKRPDPAPGAGRWKKLAEAKIDEIDRTIARATAMKGLLHQWLECECVSLEDCELIAARLKRPLVTGAQSGIKLMNGETRAGTSLGRRLTARSVT